MSIVHSIVNRKMSCMNGRKLKREGTSQTSRDLRPDIKPDLMLRNVYKQKLMR